MIPLHPRRPIFDAVGVHPVVGRFAYQYRAIFVRLLAYLSGIAALAVIASDLFDFAPQPVAAATPANFAGWIPATRPHPAFAVSKLDSAGKTEAYGIVRHPEGGRKDALRWATAGSQPVAEIEIYRLGGEWTPGDGGADLLVRTGRGAAGRADAAGVIESKFGPIALLQLNGGAAEVPCTGFSKTFEAPRLRLSGWSCQPGSLAAQRSFIGCTLNRLMLLSAGNDPKVAELFAHAELRRKDCSPTASSDWITEWRDLGLRGRVVN